jgi:hypothetical protein
MQHESTGKSFKLWTAATYHIEVAGRLDESWSDHFAGMCIRTRKNKDRATVTTLVGELRDQAALIGLLKSLYGLHLPILSVIHQEECPDTSERGVRP